MTPLELEQIDIVEPPLRELDKRHSFFASSCLGGCGFLLILGVFFVGSVKLFLGPGPEESTKVPQSFPTSSVPVYDEENLERVTTIPGRYTTRGIHLSALLPALLLNRVYTDTANLNDLPSQASTTHRIFETLWNDLHAAATTYAITTRFEWHDLNADPTFIRSFYEQELQKRGFTIANKMISKTSQSLTFNEKKSLIEGSLTVEKTMIPKGTGTARAVLIVRIPEEPTYLPQEVSTTSEEGH